MRHRAAARLGPPRSPWPAGLCVPAAAAGTGGHQLPDPAATTRSWAAPAPGREIFAYGLRNPYRFSFDRANGDLLIGDVGQGAREELDWVTLAGARGAELRLALPRGQIAGPGGPRCPTSGNVAAPLADYPTSRAAPR